MTQSQAGRQSPILSLCSQARLAGGPRGARAKLRQEGVRTHSGPAEKPLVLQSRPGRCRGADSRCTGFAPRVHLPQACALGSPGPHPPLLGAQTQGRPVRLLGQAVAEDINHTGGRKGRQLPLPAKPWMKKSSGLPVITVRRGSLCNPSGGGEGLPLPQLRPEKGPPGLSSGDRGVWALEPWRCPAGLQACTAPACCQDPTSTAPVGLACSGLRLGSCGPGPGTD